MFGSFAAFDCPTRLNAAATAAPRPRGRAGARASATASRWARARQRRQVGPGLQFRARTSTQQQLERTHRRLMHVAGLDQHVALHGKVGGRHRNVGGRARADASGDRRRERAVARRRPGRVFREPLEVVGQRLRGDEPGFRGRGRERLAREFGIGLRGRDAFGCGRGAVAQLAPQVELPRDEADDSGQRGRQSESLIPPVPTMLIEVGAPPPRGAAVPGRLLDARAAIRMSGLRCNASSTSASSVDRGRWRASCPARCRVHRRRCQGRAESAAPSAFGRISSASAAARMATQPPSIASATRPPCLRSRGRFTNG